MSGRKEKPMLVLGIMSGTSMDAVDYALCEVTLSRVCLKDHWQATFPQALRRRLHHAAGGQASSHEVGQLHHDLGRFYARHALRYRRCAPQLAGLHGQTVFHNPNRNRPATFQLGEPAYLAEALRVPVVSNFRAADIAAGGQGAPLATLFHQIVFGGPGRHICVNNLGGISNVTSIDWRQKRKPKLLAFDTGPANVLLDVAMGHLTGGRMSLDKDGAWAAHGEVAEQLLVECMRHPFFRRPPPKSTGRELFGEQFFARMAAPLGKLSRYDVMATLTEFAARSLALSYRLHLPSLPDEVILCGGGLANRSLVKRIRANLRTLDSRVKVTGCDELGWPPQSVEPAAFALMACYRWRKQPGSIAATTGARRSVALGQLAEA